MGERTRYTPGTFCWTDLTTTDQDAAKDFYSGLFGWEIEDMPIGDGSHYSMARIDGKDVAAISPQPPEMRDSGAPPSWNSYVSVDSADAVNQRAGQLGATPLGPAFDVLDAGRMALIQDPQGAMFFAWEPRRQIGAKLVNAPGALVWNELASPDLDASASFYGELLGWTTEPVEGSPEPYSMIKNDGANNGGIRPLSPPGVPPHWLVYFGADDVAASLARAEQGGGAVVLDATELGMGTIGVVQDPQGGVFALFAGQFES